LAHATPAAKSFVRLSSGSGSSLALLKAKDAPHGMCPDFAVDATLKFTSMFREAS
jgi:hypothetical protein